MENMMQQIHCTLVQEIDKKRKRSYEDSEKISSPAITTVCESSRK